MLVIGQVFRYDIKSNFSRAWHHTIMVHVIKLGKYQQIGFVNSDMQLLCSPLSNRTCPQRKNSSTQKDLISSLGYTRMGIVSL